MDEILTIQVRSFKVGFEIFKSQIQFKNSSRDIFLSWIWDVKISKPTLNERTCIVNISAIPCYHFVKLDI